MFCSFVTIDCPLNREQATVVVREAFYSIQALADIYRKVVTPFHFYVWVAYIDVIARCFFF